MNLPYISGAEVEVEVRVVFSVGVVESAVGVVDNCGLYVVGVVGFC